MPPAASNSPAPYILDLGLKCKGTGKSVHEPLPVRPRQEGPRSQMGVRNGRKEAKCFWVKPSVSLTSVSYFHVL